MIGNMNQGQDRFRFGDGEDTAIAPNGTRSIFVRKEFNIENGDTIPNPYLDIDYEDAFAALINSVEVVRGNILGFAPDFLSLVNTDKEAKAFTGEGLDY